MNTLTEEQCQRLELSFTEQTGITLEAMLTPISDDTPSGEDLKGNGVYSQIKQARSQDDPNLPMGDWKHNLKVADWDEVTKVAIKALTEKTKDIQLLIWLLEAQIHKYGFAGIAPSMYLLTAVADKFWPDIYPQMPDGDEDYRTNLIIWLNDKLQPTIRQLPITASRSDQQYCWADWEIAIHMEQLPEDNKRHTQEYVQSQTISQAVSTTPLEFYQHTHQSINDALAAITTLSLTLEQQCKNEVPSLSGLQQLLAEIMETLASLVQHRGPLEQNLASNEDDITNQQQTDEAEGALPPSGGSGGPVNSRQAAYRQLAEAAEYLKQDDPHSPVPYLIIKAIEWGNLNTAELYQELFVQYQGQLNIFEILGLEINQN